MKVGPKKVILVVFFIILVTILLWYYIYNPPYQRNIFNLATLIGGCITVLGLPITIYQIFELENITLKAKNRWNSILMASKISRSIAYIQLLKRDIVDDKYELAQLHISQVTDLLIELNYLTSIIEKDKHKKITDTTKRDSQSISKQINGNANMNKNIFCNHMDDLILHLTEIEIALKNQTYES